VRPDDDEVASVVLWLEAHPVQKTDMRQTSAKLSACLAWEIPSSAIVSFPRSRQFNCQRPIIRKSAETLIGARRSN